MSFKISSKPFQAPLPADKLANLLIPVASLSTLASYDCQVVVTPELDKNGKSDKDRVHVGIYSTNAVKPSQQASMPIVAAGPLPPIALLLEFTFHAPAGLGGAHDSIRFGPGAPASIRKNGRNVPVPFTESVMLANRMYNWVYAQAQGLENVSLPWVPLAEKLDSDVVAKLAAEEEERLQHAKNKDLLWTMAGVFGFTQTS